MTNTTPTEINMPDKRFIIPVWTHWVRVKGREWADQLSLRVMHYDPATGELQVRHQEEGVLPVPPGAVVALLATQATPMDRGYDNDDYNGDPHTVGRCRLVYTDPETAMKIQEGAQAFADYCFAMRDLFLDTDSSMLDS